MHAHACGIEVFRRMCIMESTKSECIYFSNNFRSWHDMSKQSTKYRKIRIKKPVVKITKQDIDDMLQKLARQYSTWSPVARGARPGDKIRARYSGCVGEEKVIDSGGNPATITLGSSELSKKAQKSLIGTRPGESIQVAVKHHKDDVNQSLAGLRVDYEYQVLEVLEKKVPQIDEKLARTLGVKDGSIKGFRKQVKDILRNKVDTHINRNIREQLIRGMLNAYRAAVPGESFNKINLDDKDALTEIIIDIVRENKITLDQGKVDAAIDAIAAKSDNPDEVASRYHNNQDLFSQVEASVLENQVLEHVLKQARVEEKQISYRELFGDLAGNSSAEVDNNQEQIPVLPVINLGPETKCSFCVRNCCTYITQKIPAPRSKTDFSYLIWQVSHQDVEAYKDSDGWHLMFRSKCEHLLPNGRCGNYEKRMQICRKYSNTYCEFDAPAEDGFKQNFKNYDALLAYCKQRFPNWEY